MTTVLELAGGLLQFALAGAVAWAVLELGCKIFFWVREKE